MDWVAVALTLVGLWMVGSKNVWGFVVGALANGLWMAWARLDGADSIVFINLAIFILNIRAIYLWDTKKS